jgi:hypothetical protein
MVDCGGYKLTFEMIHLLELVFRLLMAGTRFIWAGGLRKRGGGDERVATTMRKLE